jgi:hypothetical protein
MPAAFHNGEYFPMNWAKSFLLCLLLANALTANQLVHQKILLLDSTLIERSENIRIAVGRPGKFPGNPLFGEDRPWEPRFDNMYPNVIWDETDRLFKCWYNLLVVGVENWIGSTEARTRWLYRQWGECYAISQDGIHWEKPALDLLPYRGQASNILLHDVVGAGVFRDGQEPNSKRRYKMFFVKPAVGDAQRTVAVAFSSDGVHWGESTALSNMKLDADTHNNAFWAPTLNRYVAITRDWNRNNPGEIKSVRLVARSESEDFERWSDPQVILRGSEDHLQVYAMPVFYYAGLYLGLPAIFNTRDDRVHVELAWSKDTVTWHRVDSGTPLIPNGKNKGDYDWGCVYPAASPILMKDEIRIYYAGFDGLHYGKRHGCLALATLRPDGFAAATPCDPVKEGKIVSVPVLFRDGDELLLTADTEPEGSVQVSLLNRDGREVARSGPMAGSFTARPVEWLAPIARVTGEVRLSFTLSRAWLYSYDTVSHEGPK